MMPKSRSLMFLLLSHVVGLLSVSGAGINVKYACQGDSVQAFENIEINHSNANVSLQINGDQNAQIAVWSIQNYILNESIIPEYQKRLIFDQNGTITIQNFEHSDQAIYLVISKMNPLPKIYEVQLSLTVPPTKACKPMIEKVGNSLIASVNDTDCGKPTAIPYWKDNDNVSNTSELNLTLTPGMEAKEYYACIKGAALTCVKNVTSLDYCTTFKTEGSNSPPASMVTSNTNVLFAACIILGILFGLTMLALAVILLRCRLIQSKKNLDEISKLLNEEQQQAYCDSRKTQNDNTLQEKKRQCDLGNDIEEASSVQQRCKMLE